MIGLAVGIYYIAAGTLSSLLWIRDEPKTPGVDNFRWIRWPR